MASGQAKDRSETDVRPLSVELSVVVPVYGCRGCLRELCARVARAVTPVVRSYEIVLVDDGSPDDAWAEIRTLVDSQSAVRGVRLTRNFGQHAAITAGISVSEGDWIAVLDCDLEDPPEVLPEMYRMAGAGYEVVVGRRTRRTQGSLRALLSKLYFVILNRLSDVRLDPAQGALSLFSRRVSAEYLRLGDGDRHHVMILKWLGFRTVTLDYEQDPRFSGHSSYTMRALLGSAASGLLFQTTGLLQHVIYTGLTLAALGFLVAAFLVYQRFAADIQPGWTSLAVLILIVGGIIVASVGVVGLYVGRLFEKSRGRPLFLIEDVIDRRTPTSGR